jgi:hypothetical protein
MLLETILGVLGIVLTVFFGFLGIRAVRRKRLSQAQKLGKASVAIQSGRNTNIRIEK